MEVRFEVHAGCARERSNPLDRGHRESAEEEESRRSTRKLNHSVFELFRLGGPVMWPLLAASVLGLALIIDRGRAFYRHRQELEVVLRALGPTIRSASWSAAEAWCRRPGPLTRVATIYLRHRDAPRDVR